MHWVKAWLDSMVPADNEQNGETGESHEEELEEPEQLANRIAELEARIQQLEGR